MKRRTLFLWIFFNVFLAVVLPWWFVSALQRDVEWEYANGFRTSTNGDSVGLPLVMFTALLWLLLLTTNVVVFGVLHWRKRRRAG